LLFAAVTLVVAILLAIVPYWIEKPGERLENVRKLLTEVAVTRPSGFGGAAKGEAPDKRPEPKPIENWRSARGSPPKKRKLRFIK
jgi:hypothetical protein